jgi:hypothetical protein
MYNEVFACLLRPLVYAADQLHRTRIHVPCGWDSVRGRRNDRTLHIHRKRPRAVIEGYFWHNEEATSEKHMRLQEVSGSNGSTERKETLARRLSSGQDSKRKAVSGLATNERRPAIDNPLTFFGAKISSSRRQRAQTSKCTHASIYVEARNDPLPRKPPGTQDIVPDIANTCRRRWGSLRSGQDAKESHVRD